MPQRIIRDVLKSTFEYLYRNLVCTRQQRFNKKQTAFNLECTQSPMFSLVYCFSEKFADDKSMSQPKETIPVESIRKLVDVLTCLQQSTAKSLADFEAAGYESTDIEGWRTLHRGLVYTQRIVKKLTGPADPVQKMDPSVILLDSHKQKSKRKAEKAEDTKKLNEAAEKVREIRTRKPKSP